MRNVLGRLGAFVALVGVLAAGLVLSPGGPAGATGAVTPIDGTWRGVHLFRIAGSLEGGFTISAAESWVVFGCPVSAGTLLQRYTPKGGSKYDLRWLNVWATTTQGQEGVKCEYVFDGGPITVTVTGGKTSLTLSGCGSVCSGIGTDLRRAAPPKPATTGPTTTTAPPATWAKLVLDYEIPRRFGLDENKDDLVDYSTTSAQIDPKFWTALITVRRAGGAPCDPSATYEWKIGRYANAFESLGSCVFAFRRFPGLGDYRVTVTATSGGQKSFGEIRVKLRDFLIAGLGDSNGSGEGNPDVPGLANPLWEDFRCHRSAQSFQARTASAIEKASDKSSVTFVHLACSGASITTGLVGPYRGLNDPGGAALEPQVSALGALKGKRELDAVLVSIGVNDLGFGPLVAFCIEQDPCFARTGFDRSAPGKTLAQVIQKRLAALPASYSKLAARFRELRIPPQRVYLTQYFDSTRGSDGKVCDPLIRVRGHGTFTQGEADWAHDEVLEPLNYHVAAAARKHGWRLVTGAQRLFRTHGYCSDDSWIVQLTQSLFSQGLFWKGLGAARSGTLHANAEGHQIQARLVTAVLRRYGIPGRP